MSYQTERDTCREKNINGGIEFRIPKGLEFAVPQESHRMKESKKKNEEDTHYKIYVKEVGQNG